MLMVKSRSNAKLTGTAAMRVGFSTEQSPLLPFFILVDYSEKIKK